MRFASSRWARLGSRCAEIGALLGAAALVSCGPGPDSSGSENAATSVATNSAISSNSAASVVKPEFQKLEGRWERPDGGYVLELKSVDAAGKFQAGYFNPNPINVSKAIALKDGNTTKLFVELRDVNYPGCTYSLTYDAGTDQLFGQYFQASMQQTYDITFARLKE